MKPEKPFGWVHMTNGRWEDFFLYKDGVGECEDCEYCIPLYTAPVCSSDISQERVDEPWVKTYCGVKPNYTTPFECPRCGHCCQHEAALAEREAILEAVEALTGMEADRHKMFSEGYDHALYHIRQVVEGRSKI